MSMSSTVGEVTCSATVRAVSEWHQCEDVVARTSHHCNRQELVDRQVQRGAAREVHYRRSPSHCHLLPSEGRCPQSCGPTANAGFPSHPEIISDDMTPLKKQTTDLFDVFDAKVVVAPNTQNMMFDVCVAVYDVLCELRVREEGPIAL